MLDRLSEIVEGQRGGAPVEGLGVGDLGGGEFEAAGAQVEVDEEGAGDRERVDGRADVVHDPRGQPEVEGAGAAADRRCASRTSTVSPARAMVTAAAMPLGPDPTTTTSGWVLMTSV